jgi:hypothetical protein
MVSFGFAGTPNIISLKEYQSLSRFGFNPVGDISEVFHNVHYVFLPNGKEDRTRNSEKKVTNICKFLKVDSIVEPGQNSILNITLKADIVIICGDRVIYFQAKSSVEGVNKYLSKYSGKQLNPLHNKLDQYRTRKSLNEQIQEIPNAKESYPAPGCVYLNTKYGDSTLPLFLKEFSEWIGLPVRDDYQKLLGVIRNSPKPLSIRVLQRISHDNNVMRSVTHLSSIYPINIVQGDCVQYVSTRRTRENQGQANYR